MPSAAVFRKFALSLPNAVESSHMDHPDFRVLCPDKKLRIFATLSGEAVGRGVLNLTLEQQASFIEELPEVFEPCKGGWGRMGMTYVSLGIVDEDTLLGALATAHRNILAKAALLKSKRSQAEPARSPQKSPRKPVTATSKSGAKSRAKPKIES